MKQTINKIPKPRTIARHYAKGEYCDYPADVIMSAINTSNLNYTSIAIPLTLGFRQIFIANLNVIDFLGRHYNSDIIQEFISSPITFMKSHKIRPSVAFDNISPLLFTAISEPEMYAALTSSDERAVCALVCHDHASPWAIRHPERYPKHYMLATPIHGLHHINHTLDNWWVQHYGFNTHLDINILHICDFFSDENS